jgi:hypothetical protein
MRQTRLELDCCAIERKKDRKTEKSKKKKEIKERSFNPN